MQLANGIDSGSDDRQILLSGPARFEVTGNTLTFLSDDRPGRSPAPASWRSNYTYKEAGYDGSFVKDSVVDIYDEDTPTVIVQMPDDGSIDVIEGASATDTTAVRLSRAPTSDSGQSRSTRSRPGRPTAAPRSSRSRSRSTRLSETFLTFTTSNWCYAADRDGARDQRPFRDGNDTQVFAPDLQTVNKIRGPLIIEGAAGAGSLSLPAPLMLPHEHGTSSCRTASSHGLHRRHSRGRRERDDDGPEGRSGRRPRRVARGRLDRLAHRYPGPGRQDAGTQYRDPAPASCSIRHGPTICSTASGRSSSWCKGPGSTPT